MTIDHTAICYGVCTCHKPGLPVIRFGPGEEWMHAGQGWYADTYHVHEYTASRDCDGPHENGQVVTIAQIRDCDDAFDLWRAMLRFNTPTCGGEMTVEPPDDGDGRYCYRAEIDVPTDEGHSHTTLRGCDDAWCFYDEVYHRDVFAEMSRW